MKEKKKVSIAMLTALLIFAVVFGMVLLIRYVPLPNRDMPAVTFVYHDKANDIYIFDSEGNIYSIDRSTGKTNDFDWVNQATVSLENGQPAEWMQLAGKTDGKVLQKQYNLFCKVVKNENFSVHATVNEVPAVEPNTQYTLPEEYWFGYYKNGEKCDWKTFFLVGYLKYQTTDYRADKIADWVKQEVSKCKIIHQK